MAFRRMVRYEASLVQVGLSTVVIVIAHFSFSLVNNCSLTMPHFSRHGSKDCSRPGAHSFDFWRATAYR